MCTASQIIPSSFLSLTPEITLKVRRPICIVISPFNFINWDISSRPVWFMSQSGQAIACFSRSQVRQFTVGCKWRPQTLVIPFVWLKVIDRLYCFSPGPIQHQAWHIISPLHHQRPPEWDCLHGAEPARQRGGLGLSQRNAYSPVWHNNQRQTGGAAQRHRPSHPLLVHWWIYNRKFHCF